MSKEIPKKSVEECLKALKELTNAAGEYAYRGQENAEWKLESAAARRLRQDGMEGFYFERYHREVILEPARMDGYGFADGRELSDLELLANLQHHGAATCLIDFTRNFLVALWFATLEDKEKNHGRVFIVNTNQIDIFRSLGKEDMEYKIEEILTPDLMGGQKHKPYPEPLRMLSGIKPKCWYWSPPDINRRIMKQDSLFVFGQKGIDEDGLAESISISKDCKKEIQEELRVLGITRGSLFKDLPGFAALHAHNTPLPMDSMSAEEYFRQGIEASRRDDHQSAIQNFGKATAKKSRYIEAHYFRGMEKLNSGDYEGAVSDLTKTLNINPRFGQARYFRGSAKLDLKQYEDAIEDFDRVIQDDQRYLLAYSQRGDAKAALGKYKEALEDYDKVIDMSGGSSWAYWTRGRIKLCLGDEIGAREDYISAKELAEEMKSNEMIEIINQELAQLDKEKDST